MLIESECLIHFALTYLILPAFYDSIAYREVRKIRAYRGTCFGPFPELSASATRGIGPSLVDALRERAWTRKVVVSLLCRCIAVFNLKKMNNGKDDLVYKAKLAEQTERYEG